MSNDKVIATTSCDLYTVKNDANTQNSVVMDHIKYGDANK